MKYSPSIESIPRSLRMFKNDILANFKDFGGIFDIWSVNIAYLSTKNNANLTILI